MARYQEIARGRLEANLEPVVMYRSGDGICWVMPEAGFDDGRFVQTSEGRGE